MFQLVYIKTYFVYTFYETHFSYFVSFLMAEAVVAYFTLDINCGTKSFHSGFIKVDKYSLTVGDFLREEIPKGYLINEIFISEGDGKMKGHLPTDIAFGNVLYMNTNYRQFTAFVTKTEEV